MKNFDLVNRRFLYNNGMFQRWRLPWSLKRIALMSTKLDTLKRLSSLKLQSKIEYCYLKFVENITLTMIS